mmetsp:Transcript_26718/g.67357  ORF Transcript_26718/g.67357 Transcript_26718/m.67357 type:complete len:206 (+) Transcript_26718:1162-1779(+)
MNHGSIVSGSASLHQKFEFLLAGVFHRSLYLVSMTIHCYSHFHHLQRRGAMTLRRTRFRFRFYERRRAGRRADLPQNLPRRETRYCCGVQTVDAVCGFCHKLVVLLLRAFEKGLQTLQALGGRLPRDPLLVGLVALLLGRAARVRDLLRPVQVLCPRQIDQAVGDDHALRTQVRRHRRQRRLDRLRVRTFVPSPTECPAQRGGCC